MSTETKERPILFNDEMVRAVLDGRKTQTRRPVKHTKEFDEWECSPHDAYNVIPATEPGAFGFLCAGDHGYTDPIRCPLGKPGDLLWVREAWANLAYEGQKPHLTYRADTPSTDADGWALPPGVVWRPNIHMFRWASRITLRITDVRVERVQEITNSDVSCEGWPEEKTAHWGTEAYKRRFSWFRNTWGSIYENELAWSANPWVWVVVFEVVD